MLKDIIDKKAIVSAIKDSEHQTSGEIRVHIEGRCSGDVLDRAVEIFSMLGMHKTAERNGILFYLAYKDRKFAVIGDVGINMKVGDSFWDNIKGDMLEKFKDGKFTEGLVEGILRCGEAMKRYFPYKEGDRNELLDEISEGIL